MVTSQWYLETSCTSLGIVLRCITYEEVGEGPGRLLMVYDMEVTLTRSREASSVCLRQCTLPLPKSTITSVYISRTVSIPTFCTLHEPHAHIVR